ncbi:MAG: TolB family protein [Planctomycetota bacterium]|jgi:hypothetical protein
MKKHYRFLFIVLFLVLLLACALVQSIRNNRAVIDRWRLIDRAPNIRPDYHDTVIPPNIAPLNFLIEEEGSNYCVKIYSKRGRTIEVFSSTPKIKIPERLWRELLDANRAEQLYFDIFVETEDNQWARFSTITSKIAREKIDAYLVYRKIHPGHNIWRQMGIYQRNLENFDESVVLENGYFRRGCLNCHTFCGNNPDKMLIGLRSKIYGSSALLVEEGDAKKIATKFGYSSFHPTGRLVAYSVNKTRQFFHSARNEIRDVVDLDSVLLYYLLDSNTVKTSPDISRKDRLETYPAWSPDGRYLYFCSAPILWSDRDKVPSAYYSEVKYDLMRISYDLERDQWGRLETVLSAEDTGLSILEPRISPDGRWLLFCMCDYGCFPVYQQSSDLYLMDLRATSQTGRCKYERLDINSDQSESWHSWSSNSRWIAYSSKKGTYIFTRIYLSYVDQAGKVYKPILLPQKDPTLYDSCLNTYSVPEFITGPVQAQGEKLGRVARSPQRISPALPITMATLKAEAPADYDEPWQERE